MASLLRRISWLRKRPGFLRFRNPRETDLRRERVYWAGNSCQQRPLGSHYYGSEYHGRADDMCPGFHSTGDYSDDLELHDVMVTH